MNAGKCVRNAYCEKPFSHSGFCSGPRVSGPLFSLDGSSGASRNGRRHASRACLGRLRSRVAELGDADMQVTTVL